MWDSCVSCVSDIYSCSAQAGLTTVELFNTEDRKTPLDQTDSPGGNLISNVLATLRSVKTEVSGVVYV